MLPCAVGEPIKGLGPLARDPGDGKAIAKLKFASRKEVIQERTQSDPGETERGFVRRPGVLQVDARPARRRGR